MHVSGIILAAGLSSRAGTFKMALELNGKTMLEKTLEHMAPACDEVIIVGGHKIDIIRDIIGTRPGVSVVMNDVYRDGMFSSLKCGIRKVTGDRFFFTPGDCPLAGPDVYGKLLETAGDIVIPTADGRKGHPVLVNGALIPEILENPAYDTMRDFISAHGFTTVDVGNSGIHMDMDTPADYARIKERAEQTV